MAHCRRTPRHDAVELLVDLTVYAPIGLLSLAREHLPELAATGRGRVQQRLTLARLLGEMAVRQGRKEIERRVRTEPSPPAARSEPAATPAPSAADVLAPVVDLDAQRLDRAAASTTSALGARDDTVDASADEHGDRLPIDGYESLAASQVVARLGSLGAVELDVIESFERAHRNRRTVLGRIAQVRAGG
jgi:hypothetical protein